jgi:hypothetical protein
MGYVLRSGDDVGLSKNLSEQNRLSKRKRKQIPFAAIEMPTVTSEAWMRLKTTERHVYNMLKTFYHGDGQGFQAPFSELSRRTGIRHGKTLDKALQGLQAKAWIDIERFAKHRKGRGLRVRPNVYTLTFKQDFRRF